MLHTLINSNAIPYQYAVFSSTLTSTKRSKIKFLNELPPFASFPYQRLNNVSQSTVAVDFNQAISKKKKRGGVVSEWSSYIPLVSDSNL